MIFFAKCVKRICVKLRNKHASMIFLWILCSIVHVPLLSLEGIKLQQISSLKYHGPVECAVSFQNSVFLHLVFLAPRSRSPNKVQLFHRAPTMACSLLYIFSMSVRDFEEKLQNGSWCLRYWNDTKITVCCKKKIKKKIKIAVQDPLACVIFKAFRLLYFKSTVGFICFSGPQMRQMTGCGWVIVKFYILICGSEIGTICGSSPSTPKYISCLSVTTLIAINYSWVVFHECN